MVRVRLRNTSHEVDRSKHPERVCSAHRMSLKMKLERFIVRKKERAVRGAV